MKKYWLLALLIVSNISHAQNWASNSSIWRYNFIQLAGRGFIEISVVKDTLIDGINCKKLNKKQYQENAFTGNTQVFDIGDEFTYENNGVVFIRYNNQFDTLYNFNANANDSWNVPGNSPVSSVCNDISQVKVISTDNITINNVSLKRLIVDYEYKANFVIRDTIIERIGSLQQYLMPWDNCLSTVDGNEGGELRCYEDATIGEYKHNFFSDCTVLISVEDKLNNVAKIYPNPFSDIIQIEKLQVEKSYQIKLYDIQGSLLLATNETIIHTHAFAKGMYILEISENNKVIGRKKMVKQ